LTYEGKALGDGEESFSHAMYFTKKVFMQYVATQENFCWCNKDINGASLHDKKSWKNVIHEEMEEIQGMRK
jgi:hypothetical protein